MTQGKGLNVPDDIWAQLDPTWNGGHTCPACQVEAGSGERGRQCPAPGDVCAMPTPGLGGCPSLRASLCPF